MNKKIIILFFLLILLDLTLATNINFISEKDGVFNSSYTITPIITNCNNCIYNTSYWTRTGRNPIMMYDFSVDNPNILDITLNDRNSTITRGYPENATFVNGTLFHKYSSYTPTPPLNINMTKRDFSFCYWYKSNDTNIPNYYVVTHFDFDNPSVFGRNFTRVHIYNNALYLRTDSLEFNNKATQINTRVVADVWEHICVLYNATDRNMYAYVNGTFQRNNTVGWFSGPNLYNYFFFQQTVYNFTFDDYYFYNYTLINDEVSEIYNSTKINNRQHQRLLNTQTNNDENWTFNFVTSNGTNYFFYKKNIFLLNKQINVTNIQTTYTNDTINLSFDYVKNFDDDILQILYFVNDELYSNTTNNFISITNLNDSTTYNITFIIYANDYEFQKNNTLVTTISDLEYFAQMLYSISISNQEKINEIRKVINMIALSILLIGLLIIVFFFYFNYNFQTNKIELYILHSIIKTISLGYLGYLVFVIISLIYSFSIDFNLSTRSIELLKNLYILSLNLFTILLFIVGIGLIANILMDLIRTVKGGKNDKKIW